MENNQIRSLSRCLNGTDFEIWVEQLLRWAGFAAKRVGKNDCGVDIIASINLNGEAHRFYVQCKFHNKTLGKAPVQEIFAGTAFHKEHGKAVVITNNLMSFEARRYAKELGVEVIAKPQLDELEQIVKRRETDHPIQYPGLLGILIGTVIGDSKYASRAIQEPVEEKITNKNELRLQIISEFDEAEECVQEAAYLQQKAAQFQQRALDIQKRALLRNLTYD